MTPERALHAAQQILARADILGRHTDIAGELTCTYLGAAHQAVAGQLAAWMREAGCDSVRIDAIGNVVGRYLARPGPAPAACLVTGSHYDTVRNGGKYDGRLGILMGIGLVADLSAQGLRLPHDLEVVAFADEEGVRFGSTFLGSSAYAGHFDGALMQATDAAGTTLRTAMQDAGRDPDGIARAATDASRLAHYFEIHIEQGPVLLDRDLPVGVVTAIAGSVRRRLTLTGLAGHAGTTPMSLRRDAACAAAEIALYVESRCGQEPGLVGTVGQLEVPGGSINVIPGACRLSLDVRAAEDAVRDAALADIDACIARACGRRGVAWQSEELLRAPAVACDDAGRAAWREAVAAQGVPAHELLSGAGHDAMMIARIAPVSMLFIRCGAGGISHHPLETVEAADVAVGLSTAHAFLLAQGKSA
ncbi:N-carbamyl-L-amino acid amidohydrolase [Bordetella ansorpii]|uniref:N-carbamyl-L-amino acid amidohydrolase n=1 Tax=Bordetella ansorpii TaxID=288768 RepID=A0A157SEL1_9BORD|nr:allantoate amidohydrolase [Bordetella ansorpii]SAI68878.1 N-carbamyl-L-amino acid amidohydrolase [Bordetella ansorpii]